MRRLPGAGGLRDLAEILLPPPPPPEPFPEPAFLSRERERRAAKARARNTLLSLLDEKQRESLEQGLGFEVIAKSGNRYRIRPGNTVLKLDPSGSFPLVTLCVRIAPQGGEWFPADDEAIAQKLLLESDEEAFLRKAIRGR
jgi:hypothetical protein